MLPLDSSDVPLALVSEDCELDVLDWVSCAAPVSELPLMRELLLMPEPVLGVAGLPVVSLALG